MSNTMATGDLDRDLHCLIPLTQAPWVKRVSQRHISPFAPDAWMPQNTTESPYLKVGFREKLQDTDTVEVDLAKDNHSRKLVVASRTATPSIQVPAPNNQRDSLLSIFLRY